MPDKDSAEPIYPCQFPIKVIGENTEKLSEVIIKVMSTFSEVVHPDEMSKKLSKNGKYLSITFKILARSREHLEQIYAELNAQKEVNMVM
jgi:uncharacterized protein